MLIVPTFVGPSTIEGLGLFARDRIRAGTDVWVFHRGLDLEFSDEELASMPPMLRRFFERYAWRDERGWLHCCDDDRFTNHSANPNLGERPTIIANERCPRSYALRDIAAGEELLEDYEQWDTRFLTYSQGW